MEASFHLNPRLRLKNLEPNKPQKQKAPVIANEGFAYLVAQGWIDLTLAINGLKEHLKGMILWQVENRE